MGVGSLDRRGRWRRRARPHYGESVVSGAAMTRGEIAAELGTTPGYVSKVLRLAMAKLRRNRGTPETLAFFEAVMFKVRARPLPPW